MSEAILYEDLPAQEYFAHPAINRSLLWEIKRSPWHYYRAAVGHEREQTREMFLGTAYHALVLEPDTFEERYVVNPLPDRPEGDGRTKAVREAREGWNAERMVFEQEAANSGKEVLERDEFAMLTQMAYNLRKLPQFVAATSGEHLIESTTVWRDDETELDLKCRLDLWHPGKQILFDVKTCEDVGRFSTTAAACGYHLQDAMYCAGVFALTGEVPAPMVYLVSEKQEPWESVAIVCDDDSRERSFSLYRELLEDVEACARKGEWPRFEPGIRTIHIAPWGF